MSDAGEFQGGISGVISGFLGVICVLYPEGQYVSKLVSFFKDESGASAAEYALILAVVGAVIAIAAKGLADAVSGAINKAATTVTTNS